MPQVLTCGMDSSFIYQNFLKITKNLPQCIFQVKAYNPTNYIFFSSLTSYSQKTKLWSRWTVGSLPYCAVWLLEEILESSWCPSTITQSLLMYCSVIPSGVPYFTLWVISPTTVSHLYHSTDYWNKPFLFVSVESSQNTPKIKVQASILREL